MNKFKIQENIRVLRQNKQPEDRINQDKFLAKVRLYRKNMAKKIKKKKEDLKKSEYYMEEEEVEDDDDWIENEKLKHEE